MLPDVDKYPAAVRELLLPERIAPLDAGTPNVALRAKLAALRPADVVGPDVVADDAARRTMAEACIAGLWSVHDFLDESHRVSQQIETPTGSFWHGIMHRREGDYGNAKYWFRRVGEHPAFAAVLEEARSACPDAPRQIGQWLAQPKWDPFRFVDLCQSACSGRAELAAPCRAIQAAEWRVLFDFCFEAARGRG